MDIFTVIRNDHQQVMAMLDQMMMTDDVSVRRRNQVCQQLQSALLPHMAAEETIVYPLLETRQEDLDLYRDANNQHHQARLILDDLVAMKATDRSYVDKCRQLRDALNDHIQEEESEIFDQVRSIVNNRDKNLDELGRQFQEYKVQCMTPEGQISRRAA